MRTLHILFIVFLALPGIVSGNKDSFVHPASSIYKSEDGTLELEWEDQGAGIEYVVERSTQSSFHDFITVYRGPDTATFVSGLNEGRYYFRVRQSGSLPDRDDIRVAPLAVDVDYVSNFLVTILLVAGCISFIALVTAILRGHRSHGVIQHPDGRVRPGKPS